MSICTAATLGLVPGTASGQLSPGKLSRSHSHLEGVRNCNECHSLGNREVQTQCLKCHTEIQAMRGGGKGLHSLDDFQDCVDCHVEHNGEDYDLLYWPLGKDGFAHQDVGFALEGRHARLDCRQCHTAKYVQDPGRLRAMGKDLGRTYLGLVTACTACHQDRHQGQLPVDCASCHGQETFKDPAGFDHGRTAFALTGRHGRTECAKCHRQEVIVAGADPTPRYKPLDHATCASCHKDPHAGALGPSCTDCHTTEDWRRISGGSFDHDRTRYPLRGRHVGLECSRCHGVEDGRARPAFAQCSDCHKDEHGGGPRSRPQWLQCEGCHTVDGFRPAGYVLERHGQGVFPLRAAHLAVPCEACHRREQAGQAILDLAPDHLSCGSCHANPHGDTVSDPVRGSDRLECAQCHTESSWRATAAAGGFDHDRTAFPLEGRHRQAACRKCHPPVEGQAGRLVFKGAPRVCRECHPDPHQGQFAGKGDAAAGGVDCARCHVNQDWLAERFDHERDSRFPLRGGHERTPCRACHQAEETPAGTLVRFKPLPVTCAECHAGDPAPRRKEP